MSVGRFSRLTIGTGLTGTDQGGGDMLIELGPELDAHIADTVDAHDATAISFAPAGTLSATTVQAAIEEAAAEGAGSPADDTHVWMPLTTVVGGEPELVWGGDDSLIPTLTPL